MKKYFKCLDIALVYAPFAITGIIIIAVAWSARQRVMRCWATLSTLRTK